MRITAFIGLITGMALIAVPVFSFAPEEIEKRLKDIKKEYQKYIPKENTDERMKKEAQKSYKEYQDKVKPEVEKWKGKMKYDGEKLVIDNDSKPKKEENITPREFLNKDERVYIFVSSSMPKTTLKNYAISMDKLRDPNISMVLRGCIGGCEKLLPTGQFIQSILAQSKDEELIAEFIIDPNLYRYYGIKRVPAIVYASNISLLDLESSEGIQDNLKGTPNAFAVYGDVSLEYAFEKIYEKTSNPRILSMIQELRKGWFNSKTKQ